MNRTEYHRQYAKKNRGLLNAIENKYYHANREKILEKAKLYYQENKERIKNTGKKYYEKNKDKIRKRDQLYRSQNADKVRESQRLSGVARRAKDPVYRLRKNVSRVLNTLLTSGKNRKSTEELLGYSIDILRHHLEKQFQAGMTWDNYGQWHIDHIIPVSAFNFSSVNDIDFKKCWSLKNLQPLWAEDNHKKKGRLDKPFQPSLAMI